MAFGTGKDNAGALAVVSGGLDSVAALYMSLDIYSPVLVLTFDYGQPAFKKEHAAAGFFARQLGLERRLIRIDWLREHVPEALDAGPSSDEAVWVPNRNGVFVNAAAALAEAEGLRHIVFGFNREEAVSFPDNSPQFMEAANRSLSHSTRNKAKVVSPTVEMDKKALVQELVKRGADLRRLWSCYGAGRYHCGVCPSCCRLFGALAAAGVEEKQWPKKQ